MKKYILMIAAALSMMAGCTNNDEGGGVTLKAFGPTPVLRGTPIRFIGTNLGRVDEIIFPDNVSVTEITRVSDSEITAIVPQEAVEGRVRLVFDGGEITSVSMIGFSEPFAITSLAPVGEVIRPGDIVTISGDYLYNAVKVVFSGNVEVEAAGFTTISRKEITLPLPAAAVSGKIYIEDEFQNMLYSDEELTVKQPTVTALTAAPVRPGETIAVSGTDLDLIESITFAGGAVVEKADFESQSPTQIVVVVPDTAQDGPIVATASSGQQVTSDGDIEMVAPTGLSIAAASRFKAGLEMSVSGSDLALVTGLTFAGMTEPTAFTLTDGKITVIIPAAAADGPLTLTTAAAKSVETEAVTLVKPVLASFAPAALTAGESITVTGTDLDLAVSATVGGVACAIENAAETSLRIVTSPAAVSGAVVLTAANGYKAESTSQLAVSPDTKPSIMSMSSWARPGGEATVEGLLLNYVESIYVGSVKVLSYVARTATSITFTVPENVAVGSYNLRLVTTDGKEVISGQSIDIKLSGQDPIADPSLILLDYEQHGEYNGGWFQAWGCANELKDDNTVYMRLTGAVSGWQWIMNNNQHGALLPPFSDIDDASKYVLKVDIKIENDIPVVASDAVTFKLGSADVQSGRFFPRSDNEQFYSTGGEWITMTFDMATDLGLSGAVTITSGDNGFAWNGSDIDLTGVCLDNLRIELK